MVRHRGLIGMALPPEVGEQIVHSGVYAPPLQVQLRKMRGGPWLSTVVFYAMIRRESRTERPNHYRPPFAVA
jgi:hypothetical protein